jgi:hypothetical protein
MAIGVVDPPVLLPSTVLAANGACMAGVIGGIRAVAKTPDVMALASEPPAAGVDAVYTSLVRTTTTPELPAGIVVVVAPVPAFIVMV